MLLNMSAKLRARFRLKSFIVLSQDPKVEPDRRNIVSDEIGWLMILYKTDVIAYQEILQETLVELDSLYGRYSPHLERNTIHTWIQRNWSDESEIKSSAKVKVKKYEQVKVILED